MANGTPPKRFSEQSLQTWNNIQALKRQGATDREIEEFLESSGAERVNERTGVLGAAENLGRGFLQGMSEGVTSTVGVTGVPTRQIDIENARFYDPLGKAGAFGRGVGRVTQEVAQAMLMAGPAAKLVSKIPQIGSAATRALQSKSRVERALATGALSAPVDIVQGLKSETPFLLPESTGRLGSVFENVATSGIAGGLFPAAKRPVQQPIGTRRPQPPGETVIDTRLARTGGTPVAEAMPTPGAPRLPGAPAALPAPATVAEEIVPPPSAVTPDVTAPAQPIKKAKAKPAVVEDNLHIGGSKENFDIFKRPLDPDEAYEVGWRTPLGEINQVSYTKIPPEYTLKWEVRRVRLTDDGIVGGAVSNLTPERIELFEEATRINRIVRYSKDKQAVKQAKDRLKELKEMGIRPLRDDDSWDLKYARQRLNEGQQLNSEIPSPEDIPEIMRAINDPDSPHWSKQYPGNRPGFAQAQALTTLGGAGVGATLGGLTGTDQETAISGAIAGGLAGAGFGYAAGGRLSRPATPGARGSTPDIQAVNSTIRVGDRPASTKPWLSGIDQFLTNYVSQTIPMERAGRVAAGAAGERAVVEAVAQAQGAGQMAKQYWRDNLLPTLEAAKGKWDDVRALLKARRDLDIRRKGGAEKSAVPTDVLERAVADAEADPAVKAAADAINGAYRDLLTRKYQAGILSTEAYNRILNSEDFYIPFVREFVEERNAIGGASGKRWTISSSGVKRMDRTAQASADTADPLEVLAASIERTFNEVGRQNVQNVLATFADLDKIPNLIRPAPQKIGPDALTFTQMRGGRPQKYEVLDKELYDAIAGQNQTSANLLVLIGSYFKKALQTGVTIDPRFMQANVMRDLVLSGVQRPDVQRAVREMIAGATAGGAYGAATAEEGERLKGMLRGAGMGVAAGAYARPLAQTIVAMKNIVRNDDVYRNWLRQGGSTEGFYVRNANDARKFLAEMEREGTLKDIINPKRWVDALMYVGSVSEQATRLAAYKQMKELGLSNASAILESHDRTLRFAQRGKQMGTIAETVAFLNPRVQGWNKLFRMLRDPKTWGMGAAMITAPTIALWNENKDNPEYWERPVWERNMFWLIPKDGEPDEYGKRGFWRISKPFEIGLLFASIPERLLDAAAQSGINMPVLETGKTAAPQVAEPSRAISETLGAVGKEAVVGLLPIPTAVSVPGQLAINYDIFRGRPIVSRTDLPETEQITPESSALARVLADRGIAPQKTDFAVRGLFGGAGSFASEVIDAAARKAGGAAPEPRAPRTGMGRVISSRFQTRTYSATDAEVAARDRLRDLREVNNGLRKVEMSNDQARIDRYIQRNDADLKAWFSLSGAQSQLDDLAAERRAIIADTRKSQEERRRVLAEIRTEADRIARDVLAFGMRR
jgi:hypothetical protein